MNLVRKVAACVAAGILRLTVFSAVKCEVKDRVCYEEPPQLFYLGNRLQLCTYFGEADKKRFSNSVIQIYN